jgi:anti-sigma28 factor (negative regulator of flagellin synthesis)
MAAKKRSPSGKRGRGEIPDENARLKPPEDAEQEMESETHTAGWRCMSETPGERKERLRHLARLIREGRYRVPAEDVAAKLIDCYCVPAEILFPTIH